MNANERNAMALSLEQQRLSTVVDSQKIEIEALKQDIVSLRNEINSVKLMAVSSLGRGKTHANS